MMVGDGFVKIVINEEQIILCKREILWVIEVDDLIKEALCGNIEPKKMFGNICQTNTPRNIEYELLEDFTSEGRMNAIVNVLLKGNDWEKDPFILINKINALGEDVFLPKVINFKK